MVKKPSQVVTNEGQNAILQSTKMHTDFTTDFTNSLKIVEKPQGQNQSAKWLTD